MGEFVNEGRPSKEQLIREYMLANPTVQKQVDIANALQIDRHTVSKYYKTIRCEMENAHSHDVNIPNIHGKKSPTSTRVTIPGKERQ